MAEAETETLKTAADQAKKDSEARKAAYDMGVKAVTDWETWVKSTSEKITAAEADDTKASEIPAATDFDL